MQIQVISTCYNKMAVHRLFKWLCILLFVQGKYANSANYSCLFPSQWQSKVFFDSGMMVWFQEQFNASGTYYYDHPRNQMRLDLDGKALGNASLQYTFIWYFNESIVYSIDHTNNSCEREADRIQIWNQWGGIPSDATLTGKTLLGDSLPVHQYSVLRNTGDADAVITLDVIPGAECKLVRITMRDQHLDPVSGIIASYEFLDPKPLISQEVFDLPSNCPNENTIRRKRIRPKRHFRLFFGQTKG